MPASKNTYIGGMDKDLSKNKLPNNKYFNAKNIKVVTHGGTSTAAIETEKGTKLSFKFPTTQNIYKISRIDQEAEGGTDFIQFVYPVAAGTAQITLEYPSIYWGDPPISNQDLYNFLVNQSVISGLISQGYFNIYLADNNASIYIVGLDESITINIGGTDLTIKQIATTQTNLKLIGGTDLRDNLILFTTQEDGEAPAGSLGQVWSIKYDEYTDEVIDIGPNNELVPSKHLIYNHQLNISTYHRFDEPIGRYETENLQRVYWTDFHNELRKINISKENLFTVNPGTLNLIPNILVSQPTLESIGVGSLETGAVVQYGYRLLNGSTGNETTISPLSKPVVLTERNSQDNTAAYMASLDGWSAGVGGIDAFRGDTNAGNTASRSVTWKVDNIDTSFEVIESIAIYWTVTDAPLIVKFREDFIPNSGEISVTYDGTEAETLTLTDGELNALKAGFFCKSISYKYDRLLAANIKEERFDLDFEARAFRSKKNQTNFILEDVPGNQYTFNANNYGAVPLEHDAINPYNQTDPYLNPDWYANDQYKYQPGTDILGGTGANVSYKFTTYKTIGNGLFQEVWANHPAQARSTAAAGEAFVMSTTPAADVYNIEPLRRNTFLSTFNFTTGDTVNLGEEDINNNLITYPVGNGKNWNSLASPFIQALFTGYARGEVYRFGIVFRDLKGNPSFVNWIADIKFPEAYDEGFEISDTTQSSTDPGYGWVNTNQLGIEFTIDISSIQDLISGFEIVRVERQEKWKTRLGIGPMTLWDQNMGVTTGEKNLRSIWEKWAGRTLGTFRDINIGGEYLPNKSWMWPSLMPGHTLMTQALWRQNITNPNHLILKQTAALMTFHHPMALYDDNYVFRQNDNFKTVGYYAALPMATENIVTGGSANAYPISTNNDEIRLSGYFMGKHFIGIDNPWLNSAIGNPGPQRADFINSTLPGGERKFPLTGCLKIRRERILDSVHFEKMTDNIDDFWSGTPWDENLQNPTVFSLLEEFMGNCGPHPRWKGFGPGTVDGRYDIITFGAKKHILMLEGTSDADDWYWGADEMLWFGYNNKNYTEPNTSNLAKNFHAKAVQSARVNQNGSSYTEGSVRKPGGKKGNYWNYFKIVSYDRFLPNQYGGADYANRQKSLYISTGNFQAIGENSTTTKTLKVFGGDVYVNYYDNEYMPPAITEDQETNTSFPKMPKSDQDDGLWKQAGASGLALCFPVESSTNLDLRCERRWAADRWTDNWARLSANLNEDNCLLDLYMQQNNAQNFYFGKDAIANYSFEHSHQIKVSEKKIDGELVDNWSIFLPANLTEVEGVHGPINDIINFSGNIIFLQDSACGTLPIDERALVSQAGASALVLGTGSVVDSYKYISNISGTIHQHSVVNTGSALIYWDDLNKKIYILGGKAGAVAFSDVKGLSSYFPTLDGQMNTGDKTLSRLENGSYGVHGVYDIRNQRAIMTFLNARKIKEIQADTKYFPGDVIIYGSPAQYYYEANEIIITENPPINPDSDSRWTLLVDKEGRNTFQNGVSVSINDLIQGFESFLDYTPRIYINSRRRLLSENREENQEIHEHNQGNWGEFYNKFYPSEITLILNPTADYATVFNNLELESEVSINDVDQENSTLTEMELWNDYQETGKIPLIVNDTIKRRMRKWRITLPRDKTGARLRSPHVFLKLKFQNKQNQKLILHDITLHSIPTNG